MHSARSHDSRLSVQTLARAARAQGLNYLVLTDHNVGRLPPRMQDGVLVLFERELSTPWGHRVVLGPADASVVAHPSDGHRPWTGPLRQADPLAGVEIANVSAAARAASGPLFGRLMADLMAAPLRPDLPLHGLLQRDDTALGLWDGEQGAGLSGLCGVDAHGWMPVGANLSLWRMLMVPPPNRPVGPMDIADAQTILAALAGGQSYCAAGLLGPQPRFIFEAQGPSGAPVAGMGERAGAMHVARLRAAVGESPYALPKGAHLRLLRDGVQLDAAVAGEIIYAAPGPGTYRVELWGPTPRLLDKLAQAPLLYSNRITLTAAP